MWARVFREVALAAARASRALATPRYLIGLVTLASTLVLLSVDIAHALTQTSMEIQSPGVSEFGESVTINVVISSVTGTGTPTGSVTFSFTDHTTGTSGTLGSSTTSGGPSAGEAQATLTTSALPVGNLTITEVYSGDTNFSGSSISQPFTVQKTNTNVAVTSSLNPSTVGQSVTFTANVTAVAPGSGTPTGTVTFTDTTNNQTLATVTLSAGQEAFSTSTLTAGSHNIQASYGGDGNFNSASGTLNSNPQVVNRPAAINTSLTISASPTSSVFGQNVTFTVTISSATGTGTPTGYRDILGRLLHDRHRHAHSGP
jgi:large repetitive protein